MKKRFLSALLAVCMILTMMPSSVFAADTSEGAPADSSVTSEAETEEPADSPMPEVTPIPEATAAPTVAPEVTPTPEASSAAAKQIAAWSFVDPDGNLAEDGGAFYLALPGVSEENPVTLADIVALLPAELTATVGDAEETLALTWQSADFMPDETGSYPVNGSYAFTATLPEGYALTEGAPALSVTVHLGGARLMAANQASYNINSGSVVIDDSCGDSCQGHTITGEISQGKPVKTEYTITVTGGSHKITINNIYISTQGISSELTVAPILIASGAGEVELTLQGANTLCPGGSHAGIEKQNSAWFTITAASTGNLQIESNIKASAPGAGIGGAGYQSASHIRINGGTIDLNNLNQGAGIGGGADGDGSHIEINGGTINSSKRSYKSALIGGGSLVSKHVGTGENITITGGTINFNLSSEYSLAGYLVGDGDGITIRDSNTIAPAQGTCVKIVNMHVDPPVIDYVAATTKTAKMPKIMEPVIISFETDYNTLTVINGSGSAGYLPGYPAIPIIADAAPSGCEFDHWAVIGGSAAIADTAAAGTTLTMQSSATVKAVYAYDYDALSVSAAVTPASYIATAGESKQYDFSISNAAGGVFDTSDFTVTPSWSVTGGKTGTTIDNTGKLAIAADETAVLTVTASITLTHKTYGNSKTYTAAAHVYFQGDQSIGDLVVSGGALGSDYTVTDDPSVPNAKVITFIGSGDYLITMKDGIKNTDSIKIVATSGSPTITLSNVAITFSDSAFSVDGCSVVLKLDGDNYLRGKTIAPKGYQALQVINGATLKITSAAGDGSTAGYLMATSGDGYGAAIGTKMYDKSSQNAIIIGGGTIKANSFGAENTTFAAAIGGSYGSKCPTVTITGGAVTATSYHRAIGDGSNHQGAGAYQIIPPTGMQANVKTDQYHYYVGQTPYGDSATSAQIAFSSAMTMTAQAVDSETTKTSAVLRITPSEAATYYYKLYTTQQTDMTVDKLLLDADSVSGAASGQTDLAVSGLSAATTYWCYATAKTGTDATAKVAPLAVVTFATQKPAIEGTVTLDNTAPKYGDTITATANVTSAAPGTIYYQWYRGNAAITDATSASYKVVAADIGKVLKCVVTAENFSGELASEETIEVGKGDSTISITGDPSKTYNGLAATDPTVTKTGSSGAVTYEWYEGVTKLTGTPKNAGSYSVKAILPEDDSYNGAASTSVEFTIAKAPLTVAGYTAADKTYDGTAAATITAVTFNGLQNGETIALTTDYIVSDGSFAAADAGYDIDVTGTASLVADSNLSKNYSLADGALDGETANIDRLSPTVTVTAAKKKPLSMFGISIGSYGDTFVLTATVEGVKNENPDGTVQFFAGVGEEHGKAVCDPIDVTNGTASCEWTPTKAGSYTVYAIYANASGSNYCDVDSDDVVYDISKIDQSALTVTSVPAAVAYGDSFTLATTGGSGTGVVTYEVTTGDAVSVDAATGKVTTLKAGTATITATKAADENYNARTATIEITVAPATPNITWTSDTQTLTYTGSAADITPPTITGINGEVPEGTVSYAYKKTDGLTRGLFAGYTDGLPTDAGKYEIKASIAAKGNYGSAESTNVLKLTVEKLTPTIAINTMDGKIYNGTAVANPAEAQMTITGVSYADLSFNYSKNSDMSDPLATAPKDAGTYYVQASVAEKTNTNPATSAAVQFKITKAEAPILTAPANIPMVKGMELAYTFDLSRLPMLSDAGEKTYTVAEPSDTNLFIVNPTVNGNQLSFTSASVDTAGRTATAVVTIASDNYVDANVTLTFEIVNKTPVAISGISVTDKTYDGEAAAYTGTPVAKAGNETVTISGYDYQWSMIDGTPLTEAPKNAGDYMLTVSVKQSDTGYIGTLDIPFSIGKRVLTITAENTAIFAGQDAPAYSYTQIGLVTDETISGVSFVCDYVKDDQTNGVAKAYVIQPEGAVVSSGNDNYEISYINGTLNVTVDVSKLTDAITKADSAKQGIATSDKKANEVEKGKKFVSNAVMNALDAAVEQAENIKSYATSAQEIEVAVAALNSAIEAFQTAVETGTYVTPADENKKTYTITATAGEGGSISTDKTVSVSEGDSASFTFTPNAGYQIADVLVNGKSVGITKSYTFNNVRSDQTIHVTFKKKGSDANAQTGDNSNMALLITLMLVSGGALTGLSVLKKRRKS